ncbi:5'-nucleotidase C-terminal domain-containing protein [Loktanella sp. 3ANDIMAR09]|uniref:5'-nucleotidase C-terminal domain-containing protein n=1 Tax=Loktanella sp. 3ANDIMAR09 TaxID=1225657 RepID=UPI0006F90F6D|nr:5'-nucleotidase C-terminal domain-containing protein [Loktanella sp. 3ANDIMAR09]
MTAAPPIIVSATLRILQTTDLHMSFDGYNYFGTQHATPSGLFGLAPLIAQARRAASASILVDCGDFLHGTPLADEIAQRDLQPHPITAAFQMLDYDAITLGNHDFEFGLPYLAAALRPCADRIVASNLRRAPIENLANRWKIITRDLMCSDGVSRPIRIGLLGFAPPQITDWSADKLDNALEIDDAVSAARTYLPQLQRAGADLVIALCHGGPSADTPAYRSENPAAALAALPGIDVVLMGHLHRSFPGPDFGQFPQVDTVSGTIHGKPAMMPGPHGEHLGQLDLTVVLDAQGRWHPARHHIQLLRPSPAQVSGPGDLSARLSPVIAPAHRATVARLSQTVCRSPVAMHSYFATIGLDGTADLLARVQADVVRTGLSGTDLAALPILSSTASFAAGGHAGAQNFVDIPSGPLRLRDCTAIAPFDNRICAVLRRGWQIRDWLERSATYFNRLVPHETAQPLLSGRTASYHFDTIHGLDYVIDLSAEPIVADSMAQSAPRIRDIRLGQTPLNDDALVIVATSAYRARGGGSLVRADESDIVYTSQIGLRGALQDALSSGRITPREAQPVWRFAPLAGASACFVSASAARDHLAGVPHVTAGDALGDGFMQFHLRL